MAPQTVSATYPPHLIQGFRFSESLLRKNLAGLTDRQAAARPGDGHNNALWVAGHIAYWRSQIAAMLGAEPVWPDGEAELFKGMQRTDAANTDGWTIAQILTTYDEATSRLYAALEAGAAQQEAVDGLAGPLTSLVLHESYHVGQLGTLRRFAGLPGAA
jgi:hypothetical protein